MAFQVYVVGVLEAVCRALTHLRRGRVRAFGIVGLEDTALVSFVYKLGIVGAALRKLPSRAMSLDLFGCWPGMITGLDK